MKSAIVLLLTALTCIAQSTPQTAPPTAAVNVSISGIVKDRNTGAPLKDYVVSTYLNATWFDGGITMSSNTKQITSTTDEHGQYKLTDLPAGQYQVMAQTAQGGGAGGRLSVTRTVTVNGQDLEGIDFKFVASGSISGKVLDENKEPVPNMDVRLVSKEYYLGSVGYYLKGGGRTNDQGEYTIAKVDAGRPYYLVAEMRRQNTPAHAETPLNPKMRRRIPMRTWYLSSPDREAAAAIILQPGEKREAVNIEVRKSPSYCISGVASTPNGPNALNVWIEALTPSSGVSGNGGTFLQPVGTVTGNDGEFRICDLFPGAYRLTVTERNQSPDSTYAIVTEVISDQDLTGLKLPTSSRIQLNTEIILDGPQPTNPITIKPILSLVPLLRTQTPGEKLGVRPDIPGTLPMTGLLLDDYGIRATVNSPGLYVKDVTYAGRSVRFEPFHLGSVSLGEGLQMVIGQDGATVTTSVTDKDGNPVSDMRILIMPTDVASEGVLAAWIVSGQTDQRGQYTSRPLAPGKYYVLATDDSWDMTPESIAELWRSHARYQEVVLEPNAAVQLTLQPISLR